jgi:uncharacterized protein
MISTAAGGTVRAMQRLHAFLLIAIAFGCAAPARADGALARRGVLGVAVTMRNATVVVARTLPGTPAQSAGITPGDEILAVDGVPVSSVRAFLESVHRPAGSSVALALSTNGVKRTVSLMLVAPPPERLAGIDTIYGQVNANGSLRRTLLTVPAGETRRLPAVLFIGGIGCYSIDNTFDDLDAYRAFAGDLTSAHFVAMRVEKSGVGDSQGAPCSSVDFETEIAGYTAGLAALLRDPHVDPRRVFVFGHSIGGLIAPALAASFPVAGVVVADTVGIDWFSYEMINERRQAALAGMTPRQIDADAILKEKCMHAVLIDGRSSSDVVAADHRCSDFLPYPASDEYMQQVAKTNVGKLWSAIRVPVLVVYGTSDFITAESDHRRIAAIVNGRADGSARFVAIADMDHYLVASASQQASFTRATSGHAEGPFDHDLSKIVIEWLRAHSA